MRIHSLGYNRDFFLEAQRLGIPLDLLQKFPTDQSLSALKGSV